MENTKLNIYQKLRKVQTELKAPKGQYNSFGKYAYRSCEDILEALKPILDKEQLVLVIEDDIEEKANRVYVKATATLTNAENPEEKITTKAYAREEESKKGMDGSQVTGASSSYARKYCLNGLFNIDDNKDSDATNTGDSNASATVEMATSEQVAKLEELQLRNWCKSKKGKELEELTKAEATKLIEVVLKRKEAQNKAQ
jgi:hypothetical protein